MKTSELIGRFRSRFLAELLILLSKALPSRGCVYMMHRIGEDGATFNIPVKDFDFFLQKLKNKNVVRLEKWAESTDFLCLTFDDVHASFYRNAFPLLKKYQIPFTVFVSCSLLDKENYITTEMLKDMATCELCTVGSHGWQHIPYASFSKEEAILDLERSKSELESIIQRKVELYAYPHGTFYKCGYMRKHLVKDYYKYGFGTISMAITKPSLLKPFFLPRVNVTELFIKNFK